ncbi:MAG: DUF732 domain-containing protein [Candidatus Nanopelagicales bacterium]|jgi:hypothetical protein
MKHLIAIVALCCGALLVATGCTGSTEVLPPTADPGTATAPASAEGSVTPLTTPEPATAPSSDRNDFASLIREFSDDGDEATDQDLWDLGITICELFDSGGTFGDVVTLTDEQAFSPEFAIAIAIGSTAYICPEHDAQISKGIDEYLT